MYYEIIKMYSYNRVWINAVGRGVNFLNFNYDNPHHLSKRQELLNESREVRESWSWRPWNMVWITQGPYTKLSCFEFRVSCSSHRLLATQCYGTQTVLLFNNDWWFAYTLSEMHAKFSLLIQRWLMHKMICITKIW